MKANNFKICWHELLFDHIFNFISQGMKSLNTALLMKDMSKGEKKDFMGYYHCRASCGLVFSTKCIRKIIEIRVILVIGCHFVNMMTLIVIVNIARFEN